MGVWQKLSPYQVYVNQCFDAASRKMLVKVTMFRKDLYGDFKG